MTGFGNVGAYLSNATTLPVTMNTVKNVIGVYRTPLVEVSSRSMFTNTTPVGAYRGAGRPEGNYYMERLVDTAAREMGIDRVELRRRNHIQPDQMPYSAPSTMVYDSGDFPPSWRTRWPPQIGTASPPAAPTAVAGASAAASASATISKSPPPPTRRWAASASTPTAASPSPPAPSTTARATPPPSPRSSPTASVSPFDKIRLMQGDSDKLLAGGGTGGSRSIMNSGAAIHEASGLVIDKGRGLASDALEAAEADLEFSTGHFSVAGTDRRIALMTLAERFPGLLDVQHVFEGAPLRLPKRLPRR